MADPDLFPDTTPDLEIAEPHRSTVAAIRNAAGQGLFTAAEAEMLIDRVRTHVPTMPMPTEDSSRASPQTFPIGPERTFHDRRHRDSPTTT